MLERAKLSERDRNTSTPRVGLKIGLSAVSALIRGYLAAFGAKARTARSRHRHRNVTTDYRMSADNGLGLSAKERAGATSLSY